MHPRQRNRRWVPLLPGAALTVCTALLGSWAGGGNLAQHASAALIVLEAPWFLTGLYVLRINPVPPLVVFLAAFAIAGVVVRMAAPRRWTGPIAVLAGFGWALCAWAVVAAGV